MEYSLGYAITKCTKCAHHNLHCVEFVKYVMVNNLAKMMLFEMLY